ncbi:LacI family DNA-binding transcriptional regulator [Streptomyces sp. NPDC005474]
MSTVSKVLHNRSDVSAETRARVQRLLEQHGYLAKHDPAPPRRRPAG